MVVSLNSNVRDPVLSHLFVSSVSFYQISQTYGMIPIRIYIRQNRQQWSEYLQNFCCQYLASVNTTSRLKPTRVDLTLSVATRWRCQHSTWVQWFGGPGMPTSQSARSCLAGRMLHIPCGPRFLHADTHHQHHLAGFQWITMITATLKLWLKAAEWRGKHAVDHELDMPLVSNRKNEDIAP